MKTDVDSWLQTIKVEKEILSEQNLRILLQKTKELLIEESNIQPVSAPVTVCGDIHGQFYDLLELFQRGGEIPLTNYIFIGDFVDRGYNSIETIEYLFCLKVKYPGKQLFYVVIMNLVKLHRHMDFTKKYQEIWKYKCLEIIYRCFDYLNIGAIIEQKIFCIHGGLSPDIRTIDQIRTINRCIEIPHEGPFCDLMWSDPDELEGWQISPRGAGWIFGNKPTDEFNFLNDLELICRAHQLAQDGYKYWFDKKIQSLFGVRLIIAIEWEVLLKIKAVDGWLVFVSGLDQETTEDHIYDSFCEVGEIKNCHLNLDRRTGYAKGYALVQYENIKDAQAAIEQLNGTTILNQKIQVDWAFKRPPRDRK
ncbi:ser thr protein phosphatase family protein, putative [Ichthyophthirius multifiliis]|uniref:protein-serine/threonine phosphatase n=1 Tax=Ichthyophthirius multifiliis TaxID=5932 RepID=G0QN76_ICHMU|nr:ser thr protein phosphatase family protein, putative [Ichthyophthirius multifiliis]EGR33330.1 ser thr protein phosphatase family protein, putative [Ichthyophthirius multifiliis]|eukprot:XP_004037316.1 ser thr protein phosphatase family protein, putative [Ichthyophthirius multifiliis]